MLCHFLLASMISYENPLSFKWFFPWRWHFSLLVFKVFFKRHSPEMCLWCVGVDLCVYPWVFSAFGICRMIHFAKSGQFLATVHLCTFSVLLFLLLFWGSMTQMLDLFSQSYRPMRLCSFSSAIYFLLMFRAGNFYCSFSSLIIFLVLSILLLSQSTALFLKIIYCIFQLHNFHLLLLYIFWFFVEIFSLSPVFFFF